MPTAHKAPARMSKADLLESIGKKLTKDQLLYLYDAVLDNKESGLLDEFLSKYQNRILVD